MIKVISLFSLIDDDFKFDDGTLICIPGIFGNQFPANNISGLNYAPIIIIKKGNEY